METKNKSPQVLLSSRWFPPVSQKTFSKQERQKNFPDPLRLFGTVRNRCKLRDHFISSDLVFLYVRHMVQHGEAKSPEVISASTLVPGLKLWWPYSLGWQFLRDLFIKQIWWTPMISVPSWGGHSRSQWHWFLVHGHGLNTFLWSRKVWDLKRKGCKAVPCLHHSDFDSRARNWMFSIGEVVKLTSLVCGWHTFWKKLVSFSIFTAIKIYRQL